jgi:hypothetical protein
VPNFGGLESPSDGDVEVDETQVGGYEAGKPGRSKGKKTLVQVAVEMDYSNPKKPKGAKARVAEHVGTVQCLWRRYQSVH